MEIPPTVRLPDALWEKFEGRGIGRPTGKKHQERAVAGLRQGRRHALLAYSLRHTCGPLDAAQRSSGGVRLGGCGAAGS